MSNLILKLILATFTVLNCLEIIVQCAAFKSLICFMDVLLSVKQCNRQKKLLDPSPCSRTSLWEIGSTCMVPNCLAGKHVAFDFDIM